MILQNKAGKIKANFKLHYTKYAFDIYQSINKLEFDKKINTPIYWKDCLDIILQAHKSDSQLLPFDEPVKFNTGENNDVVIAFSGGLDSIYQALYLREQGSNIHLLHISNLNRYTNGQEKKAVIDFATTFDFPIEMIEFSSARGHKEWEENSFKTCLCYALCLDYCLEHGYNKISSGDDLRLNLSEAVVGTNLGDVNSITKAFFKDLPVKFIPIEVQDKVSRLNLLAKYNARDFYYSCVAPGRINQHLHSLYENKYNIHLDKYCCCSCRKCCMHILQEHYFIKEFASQELLNHCWDKVSKGADEIFFSKSLPLEARIQNLLEY